VYIHAHGIDFEWDERKRLSNLAKHGIDLADAAHVFASPLVAAHEYACYLHERPSSMNNASTKRSSGTRWKAVDRLRESDVDTSDIPPLDAAFLRSARVRLPEPKASITIRLDREVLDWFRAQGDGYQTRINAVLKMYVKAQRA